MINETEKDAVEKGIKILRVIWAALMGSLLIYLFIAHTVGKEISPSLGDDFPLELLRNIFYGLSAIMLFLAHFLRKIIMKNSAASAELFKNRTQSNQPAYVAKYTAAVMASLAICESIAIYGLVLFFIGGDYQTFYIFLAIAALGMVFYRPKREELEELARADQPKPAF